MTLATPTTAAPPAMLPVHEAQAPGVIRAAKQSTHIPALDGLRGLAILLVLLFHFNVPVTGFTGIRLALLHLPAAGWVGVDLFFVLSGFLITSILYDARRTKGYFRNFYMRRVLRIFPLYYGVLFVAFAVIPLLAVPQSRAYQTIFHHQVWLWVYLTNVVPVHGGWEWFTHFWSLAVEEQFYLVWPTVVFLFDRRWLMRLCVVLMAGALAIRLGRAAYGADLQASYYYTFCRMDALAAGAFLALASRGARGIHGLVRPAKWVSGICALLLSAVYIRGGESFPYMSPLVNTAGFSLLALFFGGVLVLAIVSPAGSVAGAIFCTPALRFLGKYSYGLYVLHGLMRPWLEEMFPAAGLGRALHSVVLGSLAHVVLGAGLSLVAAMASWHLYEKHFLKLKKFFEYRAPTLVEPINDGFAAPGPAGPATSPGIRGV